MYLIYTVFLSLGLLLTAPYYLTRYRDRGPLVAERFGRLKTPRLHGCIWVHAVSVGEVNAVQKLLERLRAEYPDRQLVLSTVTPAGRQFALSRLDVVDHVIYFPFDLPWAVRRTLDHLSPELVIVAETEIWPNFLRACRERQLKVVMVNGRISDRSLPRYQLVGAWLKRVLDDYTLLGMQSDIDRGRIETLGANASKVTVFGNLKYDSLMPGRPLDASFVHVLNERQPLWVAASTHPGEEEFVLDAFAEARLRHSRLQLLIAPRRPERFEEVERLIERRGFVCRRRSRASEAVAHSDNAVILLDTIGELTRVFEHAAIVFMGGTLVPIGGHNVLEPAQFSKPILFGPHMENSRDICELFLQARAAIQIQSAGELGAKVSAILDDQALATELGRNARLVVDRNTGATDRVMAWLRPIEASR